MLVIVAVQQEMNGTVVKKEHREDGPIKVDVDETNPLFKAQWCNIRLFCGF